jgi:hypothetical protein
MESRLKKLSKLETIHIYMLEILNEKARAEEMSPHQGELAMLWFQPNTVPGPLSTEGIHCARETPWSLFFSKMSSMASVGGSMTQE